MEMKKVSEKLRRIAGQVERSSNLSSDALVGQLYRVLLSMDTDLRKLQENNEKIVEEVKKNMGKQIDDVVKDSVSGKDTTKSVKEIQKQLDGLNK
jgi:uncharacterized protein YaaW (UPF0174 family)